jgi:integrase
MEVDKVTAIAGAGTGSEAYYSFYLDEVLAAHHPRANVYVFRRPDSPNWYYHWRMKDGSKSPRYRSTGMPDLSLAQSEASSRFIEWLGLIETGRTPSEPPIKKLVGEWEEWLDRRDITEGSRIKRKRISNRYFVAWAGDRRLSSLTSRDALEYQKWRRQNFTKCPPKPNTLNWEMAIVAMWLDFAVEQNYIKPWEKPEIQTVEVKDEDTENSFFWPHEWVKLRRALRYEDPYLHLLVRLQCYTGCRVAELNNLTHDDYFPHRFEIPGVGKVNTVRVRLGGKGKSRTIVAPPVVKSVLAKLKAITGPGKVVVKNQLDKRFREILIREGLHLDEWGNRRVRGSLRSTKATWELYYRGQDDAVVAAHLGHTVEQMHKSYYKIKQIIEQEGMQRRSRGQRMFRR